MLRAYKFSFSLRSWKEIGGGRNISYYCHSYLKIIWKHHCDNVLLTRWNENKQRKEWLCCTFLLKLPNWKFKFGILKTTGIDIVKRIKMASWRAFMLLLLLIFCIPEKLAESCLDKFFKMNDWSYSIWMYGL